MERALQDILQVHCYGCGALNEQGLQIKSFWAGDEIICTWRPKPHHIGHPGILYGGMIASVVDCHCIWTASAHAHRRAGIEMDGTPRFQYVTAALQINYRKPVSIEQPIQLRAHVVESGERKSIVKCTVTANGVLCADAELVAVRMRSEATAATTAAARSAVA